MRLPRQVGWVLWFNFKSTFSSLELGVHGVTKCSFSHTWGQESPWLQTGFSPALLAGASPSPAPWFSDDSTCSAGDGIWSAQAQKEKPLCPDVLIPCGNPLHHTWPPMAGPDRVNDCCATEVTYAHWSLQCAHKRGPPPLLVQLNAFYLEICTIYVQFSPHTTKLH